MEITKQQHGDALVVSVAGRLDAYWADHLSNALDDALRDGADRIQLDMAAVDFMSSVGIRVLLRFYKQLQRLNGSFAVANPSAAVKSVLELAGLGMLLVAEETAARSTTPVEPHRMAHGAAAFDSYEVAPGSSLRCRVAGQPDMLEGCRFEARHCRTVKFPDSTFGLGLGAFGRNFDDCRNRFGEFIAAAGGVAYLPTDGTNVPDHLIAAGALVPELAVLYSIVCDGSPAQLLRFEPAQPGITVKLSELVSACLDASAANSVGIVMVAESAGLMGAALRRSPATRGEATAPFAHPEIREWLSFTPERGFARSLALVVGVAARETPLELQPLLRPLASTPSLAGHFHAAAFSYRPLQKGRIDLRATVATLFGGETLQGVLHLLNDDRAIVGGGESEFVRGACWLGPLSDIRTERD